jgi:hypothetical protein
MLQYVKTSGRVKLTVGKGCSLESLAGKLHTLERIIEPYDIGVDIDRVEVGHRESAVEHVSSQQAVSASQIDKALAAGLCKERNRRSQPLSEQPTRCRILRIVFRHTVFEAFVVDAQPNHDPHLSAFKTRAADLKLQRP